MGVDEVDPLLPQQPEEAAERPDVPEVARSQVDDRDAYLGLERVAADRLETADPQLAVPGAGERRDQGLGAPGRQRVDQPEKTDRPALLKRSRNSLSRRLSNRSRSASGWPNRDR